MLDLWHVESRTAALMVECEALFCFNGKWDGADGGGGVGGCMFEGGSCRNHCKSLTLAWRTTFVGTLDGTLYNYCLPALNSHSVCLFCLIIHMHCVFLFTCIYICVYMLMHWYIEPACVCFARVWCQCQPRRESCQWHSIKGDYAVCRCASLCLPNDWLLTFSPCLLPAGGRGGSVDQLPPVLLPLSLAEASATAPAPPSTLGPQGGASCWATSLPAVPPALHTFIHTHTLSLSIARGFAVSSYVSSISAHFQSVHFMFCHFFGGLVLVLFSFSSNSCFSLQAVFICLQS